MGHFKREALVMMLVPVAVLILGLLIALVGPRILRG